MQCNPIKPVAPVTKTLPIFTPLFRFNALRITQALSIVNEFAFSQNIIILQKLNICLG